MELNIMNKLDHINILKVIDFYEDKENYYIVMDLCQGGDLFDYLIKRGSLDESIAATLMQQILSAINYCHMNKIVHRDLKPVKLYLIIIKK